MLLGSWVCCVDVGWVGAVAVVVRTVPGDSGRFRGLWAIDFVLEVNGMCLGSLCSCS